MPERRKHHRIEVDLPSRTMPRGNRAALLGPRVGCLIQDLSPTGLLLFMPKPVPESTLLDIEFSLPDDPEPVRTRGKVVWTDNAHQLGGVQMVDLEAHDLERIGDWLSDLVESGVMEESLREFQDGLRAEAKARRADRRTEGPDR